MNRRSVLTAVASVAVVAAVAGGGVALASGGDDGEGTVKGHDADRATAAALAETHGGTANSVERDNEDGATWEVEVTRPDGTTVDVRLDESFHVMKVESDHESAGDAGEPE